VQDEDEHAEVDVDVTVVAGVADALVLMAGGRVRTVDDTDAEDEDEEEAGEDSEGESGLVVAVAAGGATLPVIVHMLLVVRRDSEPGATEPKLAMALLRDSTLDATSTFTRSSSQGVSCNAAGLTN
jgi:hypothetical protein